jgi:dTDP-4-amino-4,6-dideoxygalactose transaminase
VTIPLFRPFLPPREELMLALEKVLYSGQISEGQPVYDFEAGFGRWLGHDRVLSFYSGTAALHVALILAGVQPGDEVITTAMTAEPTNLAILHAGGKVVWADVDPVNGNLCAKSVESKITAKTRAIMAVHYGGIPVDLAAFRALGERHGIAIIEDAAHALGARYDGKLIGAEGDFVMFSLQAIKHMTTVDGGMLTCRREDDVKRGRAIRWFGMDRHADRNQVDVKEVGYKYHMNNVNATIGQCQLPHMNWIVERHIENGRYFDQHLQGIAGLELCKWRSAASPSYWFYTVLAERRDDLMRHLTARGIGNSLCHRRNDLHTIFAGSKCELPGLDSFYSRMLHIPCGWWLMAEHRAQIVAALREGW